MTTETRVCRGECGRTLPLTEFYEDSHGGKGRKYQCKECYGLQKHPSRRNSKHPSAVMGLIGEDLVKARFPNANRMPATHCPYDFECPKGHKIDVKTATIGVSGGWTFNILKNRIPDYFLLVAFDNRTDLNIIHAWWVPGKDINNKRILQIRVNSARETEYIVKYSDAKETFGKCCTAMKEE